MADVIRATCGPRPRSSSPEDESCWCSTISTRSAPPDDDAWRDAEMFGEALLRSLARNPLLRLVASVRSTAGLSNDHRDAWLRSTHLVALAPLARVGAIDLVRRLLRGAGMPDDEPTASALAEASAGLPNVLVRLVARLHTDGDVSREHVPEALDALLIEPGDPTGLRARARAVVGESRGYGGVLGREATETALLDLVAASTGGRRRLDLVSAAGSAGRSRIQTLEALRALELDGWLVEIDGLIRFEHPVVEEAWRLRRPPPTYSPSDDIPF